ncbi:MAG: hypothetical protein QM488_04490 [Rhizobiaceae bacterium]
MRFLIPTIAFLIFAFSSPNVQASNCSIDEYDHNGSRMEVQFCAPANATNANVSIIYTDPRQGLIKHGVGNGTLLFEGIRRSDGSISGEARLFSSRCGQTPYRVSGSQQGDRIVLRGNASRLDRNCRVKGTRLDTLVFTVAARLAPTPVNKPTTKSLRFEDYPARAYRARVQSPDLSSHPDAKTYRTRLRNAAKGGVNFAGDHVLAIWGCGANCLMGAVINARSGFVQFLPGTVCCWLDTNENINPIEFRTDSNLLVLTGLINEQEPMAKYYYDFSGRDFKLITTQILTSSGSANNGGVQPQPQPQPQPKAQLDICYYDSNGAQHDADWCALGGDISIARNVNLSPHCRANAGAVCQLGNAGYCRPGSNKYSSYVIFPYRSGRCPATFSQAVGAVGNAPPALPPAVQPSCPTGFVFSGGQCVRNAAPAPSCPSGFEFKQGQCLRASTANPPVRENLQQCAARCDAGLGAQCRSEGERLGNAQGWDGDLRRDYWENTCVPRINACKFSCNPPGRINGPGQCRFTRDGGQICS